MAPKRGIRAWVIEWQWAGEHARHEGPRWMLLHWRISARTVADLMEKLYAQSEYALSEQVGLLSGKWASPYRAEIHAFDRITCGHNPYLFACPAMDVRVQTSADGDEMLAYEPLPIKPEWVASAERIRAENASAGEHGR
jgi:hypothetical protein